MTNKIIRTICYFTKNPQKDMLDKLLEIENVLMNRDFVVQTKRVCSSGIGAIELEKRINDNAIHQNIGSLNYDQAISQLDEFLKAENINFNVDLTNTRLTKKHTKIFFEIMKNNPVKTFNFTYVFNNSLSSPYFPSASYEKEGFSVGIQPTDLAEGCETLEQWLYKMKKIWEELDNVLKDEKDYLGIDSSIAPLFEGKSSLINFIKKIHPSFDQSVVSDTYLKITKFIKEKNPKPIGLCGLMFPCLEDFELADEYEKGNFSIERNIFLSLHSGLGIDTYPIGIDEDKNKMVDVLKTVQGLSNKYKKTLSIRFVSDGKSKIGEKTNFQNQYLKDVIIRKL